MSNSFSGAPQKKCVPRISLDGSQTRNWRIDWDWLSKANKLEFTLTAMPNPGAGEMPPSYPPASK